jgi:hypothetical protein
MSRLWLPPRRPGPSPEVLLAEDDEILSSWLTRVAALYQARPETLLEQISVSEFSPTILDQQAIPADLERLSIAMYSSPEQIERMTFAGEHCEALEFVARRFPLWTCSRCVGVHWPRSWPGQATHLVHLRRVVMQTLRRAAHTLTYPSQSSTAKYPG